ncbi:protein EMBRYONIC FLOWER 1-like isoform X2 [Benincasa hispida]|nr:protein EMBRYONIC FLOWER 1-like isoform X2 [Benincasa hispida]
MADNASISGRQPSNCDQKEKKLDVADRDNCTVALISQSEPGCASHGVTEIEPVSGKLIPKATEESPAALQDGKQTHADRLNGQLTLVSENDSTVDVPRGHYTVTFQENGDASMESNQSTDSLSESAETVGNSPHHCHLGKLHRRRTPKVRLLTDLLGDNGNMIAKHVESSPSDGSPEASVQADVRYAPKCQVTIEEDVWHSDHRRERRLPRNGKCRHQEIPSSSSVDKKIQTWRGQIESSVSSLGNENAHSGIKQTMKGPWSSYKMDGNNSLRRKKSKKFPVVDPYSVPLVPSKVKDQCEVQAITENRSEVAVDSAAILAYHNDFSSRTPHSTSLNAMESKSGTSKNPNSSKEPVIFEGPTNVFAWNNGMLWRGSVTQKDVETMKSRSVANPLPSYRNNERELHPSHNNYSEPQRDHKGIHHRGENELATFLPELEDTSKVRINIETSNLGYPNHPHQASDVFYGQGVRSVLNSKMANLRMPLPRQNADPHTDNSWSQLQNKDLYRRGNGKRTIEAQEPLALNKRQINQKMDQASDHGTSDDIPMEIVELMAKNQYERRLPDAENNNKHVSETGKFSRAVQVNNYGDVYRNGRELLQKPENLQQNAQARNGGKVVETRKQKSADYFSNIRESHFDTNHPQQNHMLGCNGSIHSLVEPSNGIQYSSIGSKRKSCTEIRKCNGITVEGLYNSKVQSSEGCMDHLPVSEQNIEAAYVWSSSSLMPDHLSNGYQKFPAHSTNSRKISSPRSFQMGNTNAQNHHIHHHTNLERHGRHNNNSEAYGQRFAESSFCHCPNVAELHHNPVGSLELYSNETISAMHLLSLMDARMQSNAPMTAGEKHKSSKKSPVPRPRKAKEFSTTNICFNKTIQDINQFSSAFHDEVCISATNASASTFQNIRGFGTNSNFSGQAVFRPQYGAKMKCSDPSSWSKDQTLSKSQFRSGDLRTDDRAFPVNGIEKGVVNATNSEVLLVHHIERSSEECKLVAHTRTLQNKKSTSETEICSVNKNPADFSLPEAGNIYMIGAEEFNFGRTLFSKNRSSSICFNDRYKQQRIV